jgi:uncharacterized membrane protein YsdA (DUF1294 family)
LKTQLCESEQVSVREWLGLPVRTDERPGSTFFLIAATAAYLAMGVAAFAIYSVTRNPAWVEDFFRVPGAMLALMLAVVELWFSLQVLHHFSSDEPMHAVWVFVAGSAAFDLAGVVASQVLAAESVLNPLTNSDWWSPQRGVVFRQYGLLLGGTCRFTLLAVGLALSVRIYQRNNLLGRLKILDWVLWIGMGVFAAKEIAEVIQALRAGRIFPAVEIAGWPVDLLLWFCLAQALLLFRSAHAMGAGWITRCWNAFAIGSFLICAGVVADWATRWGYLPWPWSAITWYIWLPAGAAFALAPVYQMEAIQSALATDRSAPSA